MDYTGKLRPKGYRFSFLRYLKGHEFHRVKYRAGRTKLKGPCKIYETPTVACLRKFYINILNTTNGII